MSALQILKEQAIALLKDAANRQKVDVARILQLVDAVKRLRDEDRARLGADVAPMLSRIIPLLERMKKLGLPVIVPDPVLQLIRDRIAQLQIDKAEPR